MSSLSAVSASSTTVKRASKIAPSATGTASFASAITAAIAASACASKSSEKPSPARLSKPLHSGVTPVPSAAATPPDSAMGDRSRLLSYR